MRSSGTNSSGGSLGEPRFVRYHAREDNLIVGPSHVSGGSRSRTGSAAVTQRRTTMFAIGLGFLVLFSAMSVLLGDEDSHRSTDPQDTLAIWARVSAR